MSDPAVRCADVQKRFGDVEAVAGITLDVAEGEVVCVLGPSGCGKTTLLRLIAGFERPDAGAIHIAGRAVAGDGPWVRPERRRVGFVFQDYALFPHLSVAANVGYGVPRRERATRVGNALDLVGLGLHADRMPHELSGGQQQRVALARALAPAPALILLDEPFSDLDADLRRRVRAEVRSILRAAGATAIFVTHDQDEAFEIADRVAVMREGRIDQLGRPEEVYHVPATRFVADFVGEAAYVPGEVEDGVLRSELGAFPLTGLTADVTGNVDVLLRPEDVVLEHDPRGDATVTGRRFQGPVTLTSIRLASGREIQAAHSSQDLLGAGDRVRVTFEPDHIVLFRGDERVAWVPARPRTGTDV